MVKVFAKESKKIDLLFIDGDHSFEACYKDWKLYSPYLAQNAIVVFHDTGWAPGVQKVVRDYVAPMGEQLFALSNMQGYKVTRKITTCVQEENVVKIADDVM